VDTEFGEMRCGTPEALAWLRQWMSWARAHLSGMIAWAWDDWEGGCKNGGS
jgi:hypothetical protein